MNERQENLLKDIIVEFYHTAQPVGSSLLVQKYYSNLSSATIRNEMAVLEQEGYIIQPYTSAGRIPSEKGYDYYLNNLIQEEKLISSKRSVIDKALEILESRDKIKSLAKAIAAISEEAVFVAFDRNDFYYTGISNILAKPEFHRQDLILNISKVIDHFDEVLENIFHQIDEDINILVGTHNPFSQSCATLMAKYQSEDTNLLVGILGPMRINYVENKAILEYLKSVIGN